MPIILACTTRIYAKVWLRVTLAEIKAQDPLVC